MIVKINEQNQMQYTKLFQEAFDYLKSQNGVDGYTFTPPASQTTFTSLNEYYAHMADFTGFRKYKYIMLPMDEEPLKIDLDARKITVPSSFSKCAGLQKDQLAELVVFTADRYFDYTDLATTIIYVQWTSPVDRATGEFNSGSSYIQMIDLDTVPGKIRFAWPLTDKITAIPGKVRFSVRFFRTDRQDQDVLVYSLNTQEAEITIVPALQPDIDQATVEDSVTDIFADAVVNSNWSSSGMIPPVQPEFRAPGCNISSTTENTIKDNKLITKLENDTVTLYAEAVVPDTSEISYKWRHTPAGSENTILCGDDENEDTVDFGVVTNRHVALSENEMKELAIKGRPLRAKYYTKVAGDTETYPPYNEYGETFIAALQDWTDDTIPVEEKAIQLYRFVTTFTVPTSGDVIGTYYVEAKSSKSDGTKTMVTLNPTYSMDCILPGPADIVCTEDGKLPQIAVLKAAEGEEELSASIGITLQADNNSPLVSYAWEQKSFVDDDFAPITDARSSNYVATEPGWYTVKATSELNRGIKEFPKEGADIPVCKVTNAAIAPTVKYFKAETESYVDGETADMVGYTVDSRTQATLKVRARVPNVDAIDQELLHDSYDYKWYMIPADTPDNIILLNDPQKDLHKSVVSLENTTETVSQTEETLMDDAGYLTRLAALQAEYENLESVEYLTAEQALKNEYLNLKVNYGYSTLTIGGAAANNLPYVASFKCVVTNTVNGTSAEFDHSIEVEGSRKDFTFWVTNNSSNK